MGRVGCCVGGLGGHDGGHGVAAVYVLCVLCAVCAVRTCRGRVNPGGVPPVGVSISIINGNGGVYPVPCNCNGAG